MELRVKRTLIANIAAYYKSNHYSPRKGWYKYRDLDPEERYQQLLALPKDATEEEVVAIVGHNVYTENICDECGQDVEVTVMVGEEPDYETNTAWICPECLRKALQLAGQAEAA